ncbi:DUF6879 family protein [Streptomyces sp. GQFP]|uniref:DUF6879 family protein n=1 Tax=Streptomyces sp. GQFP TaxID=2907545 RepID=UPI001F27CB06|nr:DUF6879 family protein [Streptomyces sp. GQFP]UIX32437.1 hypothetical protein LUX31_21685 [Streptomyces sp. GQFP]
MPEAGSRPVLLDGDEWKAYFRDFKRSAFRLEVHQTYTMPFEAETLRDFLAGATVPDGFNASWHQTIRDHTEAGRTMTRAKIVRRPLTPYSRYLFEWAIPGNVAAGEDYQIVDVTERENLGLPEQDFWLFDEKIVVHLNYRPDGTQINRELIQEPDIGKYLAWRDIALESAVPFSAYRT